VGNQPGWGLFRAGTARTAAEKKKENNPNGKRKKESLTHSVGVGGKERILAEKKKGMFWTNRRI